MSEKAAPNRSVAVVAKAAELLVLLQPFFGVCGPDGRLDSWVRGDGTGFLRVNLRPSAMRTFGNYGGLSPTNG